MTVKQPDFPVATWAKVPQRLATDLSAGAVHLYAVLALHADKVSRQCWPGRARLAEDTGCSQRTVDSLLAELVDCWAVTRTRRGKVGTRGGQPTIYTLIADGPEAKVPKALVLNGTHRAVALYVLLDVMADRNGIAAPPRARLAKLLDCSTDTVDRALAELAAAGLVTRLPQAGKVTRFRVRADRVVHALVV